MTSLMESFGDFVHHRHHDDPAATGPSPAITIAQETHDMPLSAAAHEDLHDALSAITKAGPVLLAITTDPLLDQLVKAALAAVHVPPSVVIAAVDMLQAAEARHAAEQARANAPSQPLPQPIADAAAAQGAQ